MRLVAIPRCGQGGYEIGGLTQMNKRRQCKQLGHEACENADPGHLY